MAERSAVVDKFEIKTTVTITRHEMDGGEADKFDWVTSKGVESSKLFDSAEEAREDAEYLLS